VVVVVVEGVSVVVTTTSSTVVVASDSFVDEPTHPAKHIAALATANHVRRITLVGIKRYRNCQRLAVWVSGVHVIVDQS